RHLLEDPARIIGTREYAPGDPLRAIHWRATARAQGLRSKQYEASASHRVVIFVNLDTLGRYAEYRGFVRPLLELNIMTAASIANWAVESGHHLGLFANGYLPQGLRWVRIPPAGGTGQLSSVLEALAKIFPTPVMPVGDLMQLEASALPWGTTAVVVTAVTDDPLLRPAAAFALLVLPSLMVRTVAARPWWLRNARALVAAAGVLSGMTAVRFAYYPGRGPLDVRWIGMLLMAAHDALPAITPQVLAALLATVLWWRGVVLGERESGYFEVERAFRRGIGWSVVFVILLALYGDSRGFAPAASAPAYLLAFFSLSLTTLAVTRLLMLWEETHADPAQALAANRHWLLLLLGVVGVIFLSAAGLATAVHVEVWSVLVRLLRPLAPVAEALFYVLCAPAGAEERRR